MFEIIYLNKHFFDELKNKINTLDYNVNEEYAFTVMMNDKSIIVMNEDADLTEDEYKIVIAYEVAHALSIEVEELTDEFTMNMLNDKQKEILKAKPDRHERIQ